MRRNWWKLTTILLAMILLAIVAGGFALYKAAQHVPEFYRLALDIDPSSQRLASDRMLQRATALAGDVRKDGPWKAVFTAEQINGWLAVELQKAFPGALPTTIHDPRVAIEPNQMIVAFRYKDERVDSVVSLTLEIYLTEPNKVALRIRNARAGALPLPLEQFIQQIEKATTHLDNWRVEWQQADGDPVAVVTVPEPRDARGKLIRVEAIKLSKDELFVAGATSGKR